VVPVGLFSDHSASDIREAASMAGLHTVQLHGREGPGLAKQLDGLHVIKAIGFETSHFGERLQPWREARTPLRALLIDAPPPSPPPEMHPADAGLTGGTGRTFDWEALARLEAEGNLHDLPPRFLAGGLTAENIGHAIRTVRPYAVDVSSGVESSRGVKDAGMIADFCTAVREVDAQR
jgi:phosphoribosylanthranilate isomerase